MNTVSYHAGETIFRQGDHSATMYVIQKGCVGILLDYGGVNETKLTELGSGQYFGEMGLLDHSSRSATAVALQDDTILAVIREEDFDAFFRDSPFFQAAFQNPHDMLVPYRAIGGLIGEIEIIIKKTKKRQHSLRPYKI